MTSSRHEAFREDRMVWAFDRVHGGLVRMGVGQADGLRTRARAGELVCPIGGCSSPELQTRRSYTTGRGTFVADGFRHHTAPTPAHEPESLLHITGKLMVADWLRRDGWTDVRVERHDTQAQRTPDVCAFGAGRQVAIEVQYSQITVDTWRQRTDDLTAAGFEVLWLWGAVRTASDSSALVRVGAVHREMIERQLVVLRLDPEANAVGIAAGRRHLTIGCTRRIELLIGPERGEQAVQVTWRNSSEIRMGADGFWHPDADRWRRSAQWLRRVRLQQLGSALRAVAASRTGAEAGPADGPRRTVRDIPQRIHRSSPFVAPAASGRSSLRSGEQSAQRSLLVSHRLDSVVDAVDPGDAHVYGPPAKWHSAVVCRLLQRKAGAIVPIDSIAEFVSENTRCEVGRGRLAIAGQLARLEAAGWIERLGSHVQVVRALPTDSGPASNDS